MAKSRRQSNIADRSSRNDGDQPLSPPTDTSGIFLKQTGSNDKLTSKSLPEEAQQLPPWKAAKNLALVLSDDSLATSQTSNGPDTSELEATWNYHAGQRPKEKQALAHPEHRRGDDGKDGQPVGTNKSRDGASIRAILSVLKREIGPANRKSMICFICALTTTLGCIVLFTERLGMIRPFLLRSAGSIPVLLSGIPGICLAYACYLKATENLHKTKQAAGNCSVNETGSAFSDSPSRHVVGKGRETGYPPELQTKIALDVLKSLGGFILWDMLRTYTSHWPLFYVSSDAADETLGEPPLFGQSPQGARAGIQGYPPRLAGQHSLSPPLSSFCQLFLPLVADGARLLGLGFALKSVRQTSKGGESRSPSAPSSRWFFGGIQALLLVLVALPLASAAIHQAFWDSACLQPFTGLMPLMGEHAIAHSGILLRWHSVFLAITAALTGSILGAASVRLFQTRGKSVSTVLGLAASVAFFCCILFDILAAAAPSGERCKYIPFTADMRSGFAAVKAFAMAATFAHTVGQLCLSLSALTVDVKDISVPYTDKK